MEGKNVSVSVGDLDDIELGGTSHFLHEVFRVSVVEGSYERLAGG